ncbi:arsinothricin resistance N-acetyltransferase ArsN1 family B [Microbulbifer sp.]|uniref:arsinothricin resistance N-acetyltransferase ArsN1 family B n=1 Tax=Microbulbifer sp. TaxID=1908541 RepID=UPI003F2C1647
MSEINIRQVAKTDVPTICSIYNHYVLNSTVTFEESEVAVPEMEERTSEIEHSGLPWLVAEHSGEVLGYAYASKWKGRCAYRFSVETTVYLAPGAGGKGIGSLLYQALFDALAEKGLHSVIGGVALPNPASVALHEKLGMEKIAHFREVGFKFGQWIDVGYWQKILNGS